MPFEQVHRSDTEPGSVIGPAECQALPLNLGTSQPAATIGRNSPATDERVSSEAESHRVFMTHQNQEATPLTGPEALRVSVVHAHFLRCQSRALGESHEFKGVYAEVNSSGQADIDVSRDQRGANITHSQKRRAACAVDGVTPTP